MKKLDSHTVGILSNRIHQTYPEAINLPEPERVRFCNALENIALTEGPEAVTPDRIQGMRELFEEVMWADPILQSMPSD
tara:strand:+ start:283 stop:519 length:237 start_codon:yes stop_codon:yes gene_type:complete